MARKKKKILITKCWWNWLQDTSNFYICIGKFPPLDTLTPVKKNYPVIFLGILSFFVYLFAWFRIQFFKFWVQKLETASDLKEKTDKRFTVNSLQLYSFTTNLISLSLILCCFLVPLNTNLYKGKDINIFPNYLWVYVMHHFIAESTFGLIIFVYFRYQIWLTNFYCDRSNKARPFYLWKWYS